MWDIAILLAKSYAMRRRAQRAGLLGMPFDAYGRTLALREIAHGWRLHRGALHLLVNPVSSVRYLEFDFAACALLARLGSGTPLEILDVSSPRLFPFWMAEKAGLNVTMINPDPSDTARSQEMARYVRAEAGLHLAGSMDVKDLPFSENYFGAATSISVIEHVDDDAAMIDSLVRVVRPGGRIVLTFPVKPVFENEYRTQKYYRTQVFDKTRGEYFFQRFYDEDTISGRILARRGVVEETRRYYYEDPPGWFAQYERLWMQDGLDYTIADPWLIAQHFRDPEPAHPRDRMGICGLTLTVVKRE